MSAASMFSLTKFATKEEYDAAVAKEEEFAKREGKPVVQVKEAHILDLNRFKILTGFTIDHPRIELNGRMGFRSSYIVKHEGDTVETRNTIYKVLSWAE